MILHTLQMPQAPMFCPSVPLTRFWLEDGFWGITVLGMLRAHCARHCLLPSQLGITWGAILGFRDY